MRTSGTQALLRGRTQPTATPMEPSSASAHRGYVAWQGLLLAASHLTFWIPPTTAQLTVESMPANVVAGKDVLLLVHNLPGNLSGFGWYKGQAIEPNQLIASYITDTQVSTPGPRHSGRETIYPNGSLHFQVITQENKEYYTIQIIKRNYQTQKGTGQFRVYQIVAQPSIQVSKSVVTENEFTILTCLTSDSGVSMQWFFNEQSLRLTDRMKLPEDNSTLTIEPVKREDAGHYQCEVSNPVSSRKSNSISLQVSSETSIMGLSAGTIAGIVTGVLVGVALAAALGCVLFLVIGWVIGQRYFQGHQTPASTPGHKSSRNSASLASQSGTDSMVPIYEELQHPNTDVYYKLDVIS